VPFLVGEQLIGIEARELSVLLFQIPLRVDPTEETETETQDRDRKKERCREKEVDKRRKK
jgi:hypothetical protein